MQLNFNSNKVAFIDVETQSSAKLTSPKKYAAHPSTRILTCCVKFDGHMVRMGPYLNATDMEFLSQLCEDRVLVAHNAPFDAAVLEAAGLPECEWFDTLPCARAAGLPGGLDKAGTTLGLGGKDKNGERLINMLCILNGKVPPAVGPAHQLLLAYNERDVDLLEQLYNHVHTFAEPEVMNVDHVVNTRGFPVDRERLLALQDLFVTNAREQADRFDQMTGGTNARSPKQMKEWLLQVGFDVESVGKDAMGKLKLDPAAYFSGNDPYTALLEVEEAMEARKDVVAAGAGKAIAALEVLDADNRARDQLVYWGAHTGRWSSRKLQVHNMPCTLAASVDVRNLVTDIDAVRAIVNLANMEATKNNTHKIHVGGILNLMLRSIVRCDNFLVADYAQVECRGTAWVAEQIDMLQAFLDPKASIYLDMGQKVFGRRLDKQQDAAEYALAKAIVLGCGYGMSGATFDKLNRSRDVDVSPLERSGLTPNDCVKMFRKSYPMIPVVWEKYHQAVHQCIQRGYAEAGKCQFQMSNGDMHLYLPSGRRVVYRNARIGQQVPKYCMLLGLPPIPVPTVLFQHPKGYTGFLYGGRICLGADTKVLTQRGVVPIVSCVPSDKVWDGENWVPTGGPVCNGKKEVGKWLGVTMTSEHMVFNGQNWFRAIDLDDQLTSWCLKWAQDSAPWSLSNKTMKSTKVCSMWCANYAATVQQEVEGTSRRMLRMGCARAAHLQRMDKERQLPIYVEQRFQTMPCTLCGCTALQEWYLDVLTQSVKHSKTTVNAESRFTNRGCKIPLNSFGMLKHLKVGTISTLLSTASTMTETMNPGICVLCQCPITLTIDGIPYTFNTKAKHGQESHCIEHISDIFRTVPLHINSNTGKWKALHCSQLVYDLMDCGPKHRFTIVTECGPAVVHNCENIVQALCRDFLADALIRVEKAGFCPVLHVHDEIVCEAPESRFEEFMECMTQVPSWAHGFPLKCEGYSGAIWSKQTKGYKELAYVNGKRV